MSRSVNARPAIPALVAACALLAACGGSSTGGTGTNVRENANKWETRDTLVIAAQSDIGSLISVKPRTATDSFIVSNLAVPPLDADFDCSLKKKPGLATAWEWSEDGRTVKLTLDPSYTWEDGKPVTADDVKFAYELAGDPKVASPRISFLEFMEPGWNPKVIDDTHLEFRFTRAYDRDTQTSHVSLIPLPRHILGDADRSTLEGLPFATSPIYYGPWRIARHIPNQSVILEPNWNFTGPESRRPKLSRVIYKVIPEYSSRVIELEKGDVDLVENLSVDDIDRLRATRPDINIVLRGYRASDYVGWNASKFEPFGDVRVRTALAHGVDTPRIIGKILTGKDGTVYAKQAISATVTPELCGAYNEDVSPYPYDPAKALALLAEAGWTDSNGDGILDRNGQKFSFTLVTNQGNKRRADTAVEIQADLKKLGIDMQIDVKESNTFFDNVEKRQYQAFLAGWSAGLYIDPVDVWGTETAEHPKPFNHVMYSNPEVDALINRGMNTPDPREAGPIWKEMQKKIYEDQPYLHLWWLNIPVAINGRFENTKIDVLSPYRDMEQWEVPADKVKYKQR